MTERIDPAVALPNSEAQQAIIDMVLSDDPNHIEVDAVAGSGKTTTLIKIVIAYLQKNPRARVILLAFNKDIKTEIDTRLAAIGVYGADVRTFNGLGHRAFTGFRGNWRRPDLDGNKKWKMFDDVLDQMFPNDPKPAWNARKRTEDVTPRMECSEQYGVFCTRLFDLAKSIGIGYLCPDAPETYLKLIDHHDIYLDADGANETDAIAIVQKMIQRNNERATPLKGTPFIDWNDQLYIPLIKNIALDDYDLVLVDERQDVNEVNLELIARLLTKKGSKLCAVGDPYQSIYGFRGADADACEKLHVKFNTVKMPLDVSYRCPIAVVEAAQQFVPHIKAWKDAPVGEVKSLGAWDQTMLGPHDVILCRNTAPLINIAYGLIRRKHACKVLGRDIGAGMVSLIKKMNAEDCDELLEKLEQYETREVERCMKRDDEAKAQSVRDRVACVVAVVENVTETERTINGVIASINSMFTDSNTVTLLSTVHKAKGREWGNVFILDKSVYMPSKWAKKPWQMAQEINLMYVAYTRSKGTLNFVSSASFGKLDNAANQL